MNREKVFLFKKNHNISKMWKRVIDFWVAS